MLRRFFLPLLGVALLATEAATAQTTIPPSVAGYAHPTARPRTLTAREKRAAATAKAEAAKAAAVATVPAPATSAWSGWSDAPVAQASEVGNGQHRPTMNVSVAPGMPLNQVGHGVSTDYHGRPLYRTELASTTLAPSR